MTCPSFNQAMVEKNKHFHFYFSWRTSRYAARSGTPSFWLGKMPQLQASGFEKFFKNLYARQNCLTLKAHLITTQVLQGESLENEHLRWPGRGRKRFLPGGKKKRKKKRNKETKKERSKREE